MASTRVRPAQEMASVSLNAQPAPAHTGPGPAPRRPTQMDRPAGHAGPKMGARVPFNFDQAAAQPLANPTHTPQIPLELDHAVRGIATNAK